jgi:hypothetical protein
MVVSRRGRLASNFHENGRTDMGSSGKKKTTMAKLNREHRLRERQMEKKAKKDARKRASEEQPVAPTDEALTTEDGVTETDASAGAAEPRDRIALP